MQRPLHSFIEACLNTASGFVLSVLAVAYLFPLVGVQMSATQNIAATSIMTVISIARSYAWRRYFNWAHRLKIVTRKLDEPSAHECYGAIAYRGLREKDAGR
jgi:hypothetical protein